MLTRREYRFLKWAVDRAEEWRGELVGNPNPEPLKNFDAVVGETRKILKKLTPYRRETKDGRNKD